MWDKLLPAIFGLLGTLIGASISAATTYVIATRRECIERERESRTHAVEVMRAARLIEDDLGLAAVRLHLALDNNQWWDEAIQPLSTAAWEQYRGTIASELSFDDWTSVLVAIQAISGLKLLDRLTRELPQNKGIRAPKTMEGDIQVISRALKEIELGHHALHSLTERKTNNRKP
jgi:hypothetical protein